MHHVLAEYAGTLTGLCVVDKHPAQDTAVLQSLTGHNLGKLLADMESHLRHLKTHAIFAEWESETRLNAAFREGGWELPKMKFEIYYTEMKAFNPSWFKPSTLPQDYEIIAWDQMTPEEREQTEQWAEQDHYLLSGQDEILPREKINSLILRHKGKIAGWVETHRESPEIIRYTSLFLFPPYLYKGLAIPFLSESLQRHKLSQIPIAVFHLNLRDTPRTWINFVHKKLAPHAYMIKTIITSKKNLSLL